MPFPTGFLCLIDKLIKASVTDWEINSKLFVSPLIIQPRAITPSYFLIYFSIIKGISNVPGASVDTYQNPYVEKDDL